MQKMPRRRAGKFTPVVETADTASVPDISVVITTRNRATLLEPTLVSLAQQITDARWELVLIDNGSTDTTAAVIRAAAEHLPIRAYRFKPAGKCRAQNIALAHVRGELVVFTDDDVAFDPGWIAALRAAASRWPSADLFGGAIRVSLMRGVPDWLAGDTGQAIIERHCAHYYPRADEGPTDIPPIGPNMAIRRRALADMRFDENVGPDGTPDYIKGGDTDLNQALMARGHCCVFVPDARVDHHVHADQLRLDALVGGAYRRGRKNAYLYPRRSGLCVAGAPVALWIRLFKQWLRYRLISRGSKPLQRYQTGVKYHYRRGFLAQTRRQHGRPA